MLTIRLTEQERVKQQLDVENLRAAVGAIREDGYVCLERVVDPAHVAAIHDAMLADAMRRVAENEGIAENRHIMQHPPRAADLLFEDVLANPFGIQVAEAVIGPAITIDFYESNTNLPGSTGQRLHTDMKPREATDSVDHPTNVMVLNIPLVDFTVENGATVVWPGTHFVPTEIGSRWVSEELQEQRSKVRPKEQAVMSAGSMLIRDIRLWHGGVPNRSDTVRTMLAMIINGKFDRETGDRSKLASLGTFAESTRPFFEGLRVVTNPTYEACASRL